MIMLVFWGILGLYVAFVLALALGVFLLRRKNPTAIGIPPLPFVSILLPMRNEQVNIQQCLKALREQDYPADRYELIVIDDHSEDACAALVQAYLKDWEGLKLLRKSEGQLPGKKAALQMGIDAARAELILTTDADCLMTDLWLQTMVSQYLRQDTKMLIGPVEIAPRDTWFGAIQALEFMSLGGTTAGTAAWGQAVMCNGANLMFSKLAFEAVDGYRGNEDCPSGDDVFLLHKFKQAYPGQIRFAMDRACVVQTHPVPGLKDFFRQRVRWAAKAGRYRDLATLLSGALVAAMNLFPLILLALSLVVPMALSFLAVWWIVKTLVDMPLILQMCRFLKRTRLMLWYLPLQILYPFYVSLTLLLAWRGVFSWKAGAGFTSQHPA